MPQTNADYFVRDALSDLESESVTFLFDGQYAISGEILQVGADFVSVYNRHKQEMHLVRLDRVVAVRT